MSELGHEETSPPNVRTLSWLLPSDSADLPRARSGILRPRRAEAQFQCLEVGQ